MHCASAGEGAAGAAKGLTLRCSPAERRVWTERGDGASRKIVFSSTFDSVLDHSSVDPPKANEVYDSAIAPAVAAAAEGKLGCVLCVGGGGATAKRTTLWEAMSTLGFPPLLAAADKVGGSLVASALHAHWERLTDLVDGQPLESSPPTGGGAGGGGLWGSASRTLTSVADGAAFLSELPAAADAAETASVGASGTGHIAVQLQLLDGSGGALGRVLLVDAADLLSVSATTELLQPTLCHQSHSMLSKVLSKPTARAYRARAHAHAPREIA